MKYLLLFIGGNIPADKREQSIQDRLTWMEELKAQGKLIDGSPLYPEGKVIATNIATDFVHADNSVNGYAIIEAEDIDEATKLALPAPQLLPEYGAAKVEIRLLQPLK